MFYHPDQVDEDTLEFAKFVTTDQAKNLIGNHGYTPYESEAD
ncbi:hypothetical protein JCM19241_5151 [Vibrio ishigakensis]|uniref:Uncharacterized protein n=1 Tax=Vibrio ishigakensis TaxID=1481914 RepID=A0A0B8Q323_9VIBR|nr:hypothetical protein JCM19241_5151 [Vibrio ishigakensis]